MNQRSNKKSHRVAVALAIAVLFANSLALTIVAQEPDLSKKAALELLQQSRFTEALPLLEKLTTANPTDAELMFYLGFCRFSSAAHLKGADARKQARLQARTELLKAKQLGFKDPLLETILDSLPPDGGGEKRFSESTVADDAMREGEAAFVHGNLQEAVAAYKRALEADAKLYEAALFAGDASFKAGNVDEGIEWFARAVVINPDRETAYRYWATPLMEQGKYDEAQAKYIEAVVAEPYNRLSWAGLQRWAKATNATLSHPILDVPTNVTKTNDKQTTITLDPKMVGNKEDGSAAWLAYGLERALWSSKKFAEQYPNERTYRHSLAEEAAALRLVIQSVKEQTKDKKNLTLNVSLQNLLKLDEAGLLEPFILMARADDGIAVDYPAYLHTNREKLRRYVVEVVISK